MHAFIRHNLVKPRVLEKHATISSELHASRLVTLGVSIVFGLSVGMSLFVCMFVCMFACMYGEECAHAVSFKHSLNRSI